MYNFPRDFIRVMRTVLGGGDRGTDQQLSIQAVEYDPNHEELKKYADVLAPPRVTLDERLPYPDAWVNQDWLKENKAQYRNRWVALCNGQLLADGSSVDELVAQLGDLKGIFLTVIY